MVKLGSSSFGDDGYMDEEKWRLIVNRICEYLWLIDKYDVVWGILL